MTELIDNLRSTGQDQRARFSQADSVFPVKAALPPASLSTPTDAQPDAELGKVAAKVHPPCANGTVVRDTFSMPPCDSDLIDNLRARAARHGRICFRSEIVRAALRSLAALDEVNMIAAVDAVERVEPGKKKMRTLA